MAYVSPQDVMICSPCFVIVAKKLYWAVVLTHSPHHTTTSGVLLSVE